MLNLILALLISGCGYAHAPFAAASIINFFFIALLNEAREYMRFVIYVDTTPSHPPIKSYCSENVIQGNIYPVLSW